MINNNLKRVAVITGSSRGIGKAIAKEFAKNNYSVLLNARDENEIIEAAQEIRNEVNDPHQVAYLTGDISDEKTCISLKSSSLFNLFLLFCISKTFWFIFISPVYNIVIRINKYWLFIRN